MPFCKGCEQEKDLSEFVKDSSRPSGHSYKCKPCRRAAGLDFNPTYRRSRNMFNDYGLSRAEYNELVTKQNGKCAICGTVPEKELQVDHCHVSKKIRGLLCGPCNTGIGMLGDNIEAVLKAVEYLRKFEEVAELCLPR